MTQRHRFTVWVDVEGSDGSIGSLKVIEALEEVASEIGRRVTVRSEGIDSMLDFPGFRFPHDPPARANFTANR